MAELVSVTLERGFGYYQDTIEKVGEAIVIRTYQTNV
jgi:hypothetical protein